MRHHSLGPESDFPILDRDDDTEEVYPVPVDTVNGSFTYPREWPLSFRETSTINITWYTAYESVNLYYYQSGKVVTSIQITTNLAREWYQWEVNTDETNLTLPFVFRIANARGREWEKNQEGFWSTSFYITRNAIASHNIIDNSVIDCNIINSTNADHIVSSKSQHDRCRTNPPG